MMFCLWCCFGVWLSTTRNYYMCWSQTRCYYIILCKTVPTLIILVCTPGTHYSHMVLMFMTNRPIYTLSCCLPFFFLQGFRYRIKPIMRAQSYLSQVAAILYLLEAYSTLACAGNLINMTVTEILYLLAVGHSK